MMVPVEAMKKLTIEDRTIDDKRGTVNEVEYPDRPGEPVCLYFMQNGTCSYGRRCRFNHPTNVEKWIQDTDELPERDGQPECKFFVKTGTCKFGSSCRYHHPQYRYFMLNTLGLPMRQGEPLCDYYMRNGTCKFGALCKFDHPQPFSTGNSFLPTHVPYGSNAISLLPSSGTPYVGGVVDISTSNTTFVSNPSLQVPQNHVPVVPPSQVWSRYMGTMGQSSATAIVANPTSNSQVHVSPSVFNLPDRPDRPECRDFVNTGNCRYGADCKYHHPRTLPSSLGLLGLPSRPGQPICAYYAQYGLCRYGPTCQFDHPWPGYFYLYNFGMPSPLPGIPTAPYQWSSPMVLLAAETDPPKSSKHAEPLKKAQSSVSKKVQHVHPNTLPSSSVSREVSRDRSD
ncbi:OLC1v1024850C2 [Oldenlandia corymbosa var. corymbosa]|uniref:OLC1v1024850C2 n=1 Tax=Oldenlandia corymbosa var. corymbosa TaxID=529605 RepID=A0AAV1C667_OLDCO|nr:OLC1v1024850C2 [Oldenlandia corymbosa var. corymbosa]